jgi:hypothetical protein
VIKIIGIVVSFAIIAWAIESAPFLTSCFLRRLSKAWYLAKVLPSEGKIAIIVTTREKIQLFDYIDKSLILLIEKSDIEEAFKAFCMLECLKKL